MGALLDCLAYPFRGGALAAMLVLAGVQVAAAYIPLVGLLFSLITWLALYKFALEAFAASGSGRSDPPDVLGQVDASVHTRHVWVQLLVMAVMVASLIFAPQASVAIALVSALVLPGMIFALTIGQNLLAALNPLNWLQVAAKLGLGYVLLALAWSATLLFQTQGFDLFALLPNILALAAYYLVMNYLVIALFRWMGLFLHSQGAALGFSVDSTQRPTLARERERTELEREVREANEIADPRQRADALKLAVQRGASDAVHKAYREALTAVADLAALSEHARIRCSELIALDRIDAALQLALDTLQLDPEFSLPESEHLNRLLDLAERGAHWSAAASLASNYRQRFPKRRDSLRLAARAAVIYANELDDGARAATLLDAAITDAQTHGEAEPYVQLRTRLKHGLRLRLE